MANPKHPHRDDEDRQHPSPKQRKAHNGSGGGDNYRPRYKDGPSSTRRPEREKPERRSNRWPPPKNGRAKRKPVWRRKKLDERAAREKEAAEKEAAEKAAAPSSSTGTNAPPNVEQSSMTPTANTDLITKENVTVTPAENDAPLEANDAIHQDDPLDTSFESTIPSTDDIERPTTSVNTVRALAIVLRTLTQGINPAINDPEVKNVPVLRPTVVARTQKDHT